MSHKCSYTWEIHDFRSISQFRHSPTFSIDHEYEWGINLYPRGSDRINNDYVSVFIELLSSPKYSNMSAKCTLAILDAYDHRILTREVNWRTMDLGVEHGYENFVSRKDLLEQHYLHRGSLKLFCEIEYRSPDLLNNISLYHHNNDLAEMLMNNTFSDVTFQVHNKRFPAHKVILAAKSPKFYTALMLSTSKNITIVDVTPEIFEEMLRYIYTGKVRHLHIHAKNLMVAAKNYKMYDLRDMCVNYFIERLTVDNAVDMIQLAQQCNCRALENEILDFINKKFIKESPQYLVSQLTYVLKHSKLN